VTKPFSIVELPTPERQVELAKALRDMADQAERGELLEAVVVYRTSDGKTGNYQSNTQSRARMAGALLDAAIRRLGYLDDV
jgi:hypothetical protein